MVCQRGTAGRTGIYPGAAISEKAGILTTVGGGDLTVTGNQIVDGTLYVSRFNQAEAPAVVAFDARSGEQQWESDPGHARLGLAIAGDLVLTQLEPTEEQTSAGEFPISLVAFDRAKGSEVWRFTLETDGAAAARFECPLAVQDDTVYAITSVGTSDGIVNTVLHLLDLESGEVTATMPNPADRPTGPGIVLMSAVADGHLLASGTDGSFFSNGDSRVAAFDIESGEEVWRFPVQSGPRIAVAGERVFVPITTLDVQDLAVLDLATGAEVWRTRLSEYIEAPVVVFDDVVILGANPSEDVVAYSLDGEQLWRVPVQERVLDLIGVEGTLVVGLGRSDYPDAPDTQSAFVLLEPASGDELGRIELTAAEAGDFGPIGLAAGDGLLSFLQGSNSGPPALVVIGE